MMTLDWLTSSLVDEVDGGFGVGEGGFEGREALAARHRGEGGAEFGFHGGGVEVAGERDDDVAAEDGAGVPGFEVV